MDHKDNTSDAIQSHMGVPFTRAASTSAQGVILRGICGRCTEGEARSCPAPSVGGNSLDSIIYEDTKKSGATVERSGQGVAEN